MKQFKEIRAANNKMAFLKRVKERFPKIAKSRPTMDRIVQIVKPKNQINSKRYVELGKLYDSGNMKKLNDLITKFEKEDGIRETFTEFRMPPITMGRDNTIVGVREKDIAEVRNILQADIVGLKHISDIEIRFSDEKEWKRMSALVKKELKKPAYKGVKDVYFVDDPLQIGFGDPKGKSKINIKPIVDLIIKQTKDPKTRLKSLVEEKETKNTSYLTWNNKIAKANEGTMGSGIFDDDKNKAKDAARKLVQFLRANKDVRIFFDPDNPKKDHKDLAAYTKELTNYVFDDQMLDDLIPDPKRNKKNYGKKANDIVTKRLKQLGVNIR